MLCKLDTVIVDTRLSQNTTHPYKNQYFTLYCAYIKTNHGQFYFR